MHFIVSVLTVSKIF